MHYLSMQHITWNQDHSDIFFHFDFPISYLLDFTDGERENEKLKTFPLVFG